MTAYNININEMLFCNTSADSIQHTRVLSGIDNRQIFGTT